MRAIGLDIGTTTLSATVLDPDSGEVLASRTVAHESALPGPKWARLQDPLRIRALALSLVAELCRTYAPVGAIGLTGQMHGVAYLDEAGQPLGPLITWQDGRGNLRDNSGETCSERLSRLTGYPAASGYGLTTHYYNLRNDLVPEGARSLATIADCVGLWLTGSREPLLHASNAASLGLFDVARKAFDESALAAAGIDPALLPRVVTGPTILGRTDEGAVVSVAIGDNQASFAGSVRASNGGVLVNVGTGGQISVGTPSPAAVLDCETRPGADGGYLLVGSSLCGGRAYALLGRFFREAAARMGAPDGEPYEWMNRAAAEALGQTDAPYVDTAFGGTRREPGRRGAITNLSLENFTPGGLCLGVLRGIAEELCACYRAMPPTPDGAPRRFVGSGNGIRLNPVLRDLFGAAFGQPLAVPAHREEAAYGAALCACVAGGRFPDIASAQALIRYVP